MCQECINVLLAFKTALVLNKEKHLNADVLNIDNTDWLIEFELLRPTRHKKEVIS